ncbi:uncharacterized protein [Engystomops pustulosus]|uniref:uncharacterized protein n=1 Tax=Engystomops pustulosus TaxID=76066 RepID=UPI003AFB4894
MAEVVKYLRTEEVLVVPYLDDFLLVGDSEKVDRLLLKIKDFQKRKYISIRAAMSLLGSMTSCIQCVAWCQNHTRPLQSWILSKWDKDYHHLNLRLEIPSAVKKSLNWWKDLDHLQKGVNWVLWPITQIQTDASTSGWGALLPGKYVQGLWSHSMTRASSNERELKAILKTLEACTKDLKGKHLKIFSDNTTAVAYLKRQGRTRSKKLQTISQEIFS